MILLDTNVVFELARLEPNRPVAAFLRRFAPDEMFTAAICEAEIRYGLARMAAGRRRDGLRARLDALFASAFQDQVLPFDRRCAVLCGDIRASRDAIGRPIGVPEAMIAATARAHHATLITRNVSDFPECGVQTVDPWVIE